MKRLRGKPRFQAQCGRRRLHARIPAAVCEAAQGAAPPTAGRFCPGTGHRYQERHGQKSQLKAGIKQAGRVCQQEAQRRQRQQVQLAGLPIKQAAGDKETEAHCRADYRRGRSGDESIGPRGHDTGPDTPPWRSPEQKSEQEHRQGADMRTGDNEGMIRAGSAKAFHPCLLELGVIAKEDGLHHREAIPICRPHRFNAAKRRPRVG